MRRTASLKGNVLKTVAGAPVALLRSGLSGLRAVAVMFMNPLAVLRGGLAAAGAVLRVLASGPLAMLRVALYAIDDAEWTITTLTHTVSPDNGFTTSIELEVKIYDLEME